MLGRSTNLKQRTKCRVNTVFQVQATHWLPVAAASLFFLTRLVGIRSSSPREFLTYRLGKWSEGQVGIRATNPQLCKAGFL